MVLYKPKYMGLDPCIKIHCFHSCEDKAFLLVIQGPKSSFQNVLSLATGKSYSSCPSEDALNIQTEMERPPDTPSPPPHSSAPAPSPVCFLYLACGLTLSVFICLLYGHFLHLHQYTFCQGGYFSPSCLLLYPVLGTLPGVQ